MIFDGQAPAAPEIAVGPDPGLAAVVVTVLVLAMSAVAASGIGFFWAVLLGGLAVFAGARAVLGLLKPRLVLRLDDERLCYRRGRTWSSLVRQPFVSPFFIGWRGRGLSGFGVFAGQLSKNDFRRLARCLRQSGSPMPE